MSEQHLREGLEELAGQVPDREGLEEQAWAQARRTRCRRIVLAGVAAAAVLVAGVAVVPQLASIASPFAVSSGDNSPAGTEENPPFATSRTAGTDLAGTLPGKLVLVDGCVYLDITAHDARLLLMFPPDSTWDPARQQITFDDSTVSIGDDHVSFGGGLEPASRANYIPAGCHYDHNNDQAFWQVSG